MSPKEGRRHLSGPFGLLRHREAIAQVEQEGRSPVEVLAQELKKAVGETRRRGREAVPDVGRKGLDHYRL